MTGALNALRSGAVELLEGCGIHAMPAMEPEARRRLDRPVVAVSLSRVVCAPGGFENYLGLRANPDTGLEDELYGRQVELTLSLDIYAPRTGGESACQTVMALMAEALTCHGVAGLTVCELTAGEVTFLEGEGAYRLPVSCLCRGWLVAVVDGGGGFVDFEVKGRQI